jgi:hypothetical protein
VGDDRRLAAGCADRLRDTGAEDQVDALLARDPAAHAPLHNPLAVAALLHSLSEANAGEQVSALAARAAAQATLDSPLAAIALLDALEHVGEQRQAGLLTDRLPPAGMFEVFLDQADHQERFRFGRNEDGSPARQWGWPDLADQASTQTSLPPRP